MAYMPHGTEAEGAMSLWKSPARCYLFLLQSHLSPDLREAEVMTGPNKSSVHSWARWLHICLDSESPDLVKPQTRVQLTLTYFIFLIVFGLVYMGKLHQFSLSVLKVI